MRVPIGWLAEYVDVPAGTSVEDLDSIERGLKPLLKALRRDDAILQKLRDIENRGASAAAVAGNTSLAKLQGVQPKFVRRTYQALNI